MVTANRPKATGVALLDSKLNKFRGAFLLQCDYDLKLLGLEDLPTFYKSVLTAWQQLYSKTSLNGSDMKQEIIWNNRFTRINGKMIFNKMWMNKGILRISDLLDTRQFG